MRSAPDAAYFLAWIDDLQAAADADRGYDTATEKDATMSADPRRARRVRGARAVTRLPGRHRERHRTHRIGWLRAAVLGANDGIVSTASLVLGVAAAHAGHGSVLVAGVAGLVAGAMSMAAGEYVSVQAQADTEEAELARERAELKADDKGEHRELTAIYVGRGLEPALAQQVAEQLMAHDALGAHARDELGITEQLAARPLQAALTSAASFAGGAALPLLVTAPWRRPCCCCRSSRAARWCSWRCSALSPRAPAAPA